MNASDAIMNRFAATGVRLLGRYGAPIDAWTKPAPQADDAEPWRDTRDGDAEPQPFQPVMAFFSPADLKRSGITGTTDARVNGIDVSGASWVGLLAGDCGFTPETTDKLTWNGEDYEIIVLDAIMPTNIPILFYVWVK